LVVPLNFPTFGRQRLAHPEAHSSKLRLLYIECRVGQANANHTSVLLGGTFRLESPLQSEAPALLGTLRKPQGGKTKLRGCTQRHRAKEKHR
jgi:hypothetical protein